MTSLRLLAETAVASPEAICRLWQRNISHAGRLVLARASWTPEFVPAGNGWELDQPYTVLAAGALRFGEAFLALDIAAEGRFALDSLRQKPALSETQTRLAQDAADRLGHVEALALARTGSTSVAQERLARLFERDKANPEVVGALARTFKDFAVGADMPSDLQRRHLEQANQLYLEGYRRSQPPSVYLGINAAATSLWLGEREKAAALAAETESLCRATLAADPEEYWTLATLAEALLLQRRLEDAVVLYAEARRTIDHSRRWADLSTTRQQAQRHCEALGLDPGRIEAALRFPRLALFSGHMIDAPDRRVPRFPDDPRLIERIAGKIGAWLERERIGFAQCAAACGGDLIFIDELVKRGGEVHVVMPWREEDFLASSVRPGGERWVRQYERLREHFRSITCLTQQTLPSVQGLGFEYCNCCINGIALQRARVLGAAVRPLALWDGQPGDGRGGTEGFVAFWQRRQASPEIIGLPADSAPLTASMPALAGARSRRELHEVTASRGQPAIKTILFADVAGYSGITEAQIENFAPQFLGTVSTLIAQAGLRQPIHTNTWGDALYMVFDEAIDAGAFALELRATIQSIRWSERGLPDELSVRIGLHTGPVTLCVDPVLRQMTFVGSHVNHAARIEPVVEKGEIFATEAFVAFVEIARSDAAAIGFHCDYLGQMDFAKGYGRYPLFRLRLESGRGVEGP
jgi:class 3 adenylate cyclase